MFLVRQYIGALVNHANDNKAGKAFVPGDIILSADRKTRYQVQRDGSWQKISEQTEGEYEEVVNDMLRKPLVEGE